MYFFLFFLASWCVRTDVLIFSLLKANVSGCLYWLVSKFSSFSLPIFLYGYQLRGKNSGKILLSLNAPLQSEQLGRGRAMTHTKWLHTIATVCNKAERGRESVCVVRGSWTLLMPTANTQLLEQIFPSQCPLIYWITETRGSSSISVSTSRNIRKSSLLSALLILSLTTKVTAG